MRLDHHTANSRALVSSLAIALVLAASARAQSLVRSVNGPTGAQYGKACIVVPDQNNDGFKDVLVGAPGFNGGRGAVFCLSGAYLASGTGVQHVWSVTPTLNAGDQFGFAIANVGDVTLDGVADFLVGEPGHDVTATPDCGAVRLIDGATHAVGFELFGNMTNGHLGTAIAAISDLTGDGAREVAVGAPGAVSTLSHLYILRGAALPFGGSIGNTNTYLTVNSGGEFGAALASGFDFDGDGHDDLVVGAPSADNFTPGSLAGGVYIISIGPSAPAFLGSLVLLTSGERFGQSVALGDDYDGDGKPDIVVGVPNAPDAHGGQAGRAVVLSGGRLVNHTPPYEIYAYGNSGGGLGLDFHFGAAVCACDDLNRDGVGDFLIGTPDFFTFVGLNHKGTLAVYSGATGSVLCSITGGSNEQLGQGLAGAIDDLDGDGFKEFVVAGALADNNGTDSGVVKCYHLFPLAPSTYCTGKVNSLGCTPSISYSGTPSMSSGSPFNVTATSFVNQKNGLLFYSHAPTVALFQGGTKCVADPTTRTAVQSSSGSSNGSDCTGSYSFDFNSWIVNGWDFSLAAGNEIYAQYWSRDPASPSHTSLSNAVRFVINP